MCDVKLVGSLVDLKKVCDKTGKPICIDNESGSFCEDMCGLENKDDSIDEPTKH